MGAIVKRGGDGNSKCAQVATGADEDARITAGEETGGTKED